MADRQLAAHGKPPRADRADLQRGSDAGPDGRHLGVHRDKLCCRLESDHRRLAGPGGRLGKYVDHVIVDHDRTYHAGPTAGGLGRREQPVVNEHITGDLANARGLHFACDVLESRQRIGRHDLAVQVSSGVSVVIILKNHPALGPGATTHGQVALGDQKHVAVERSLGVDLPAPDQRCLEPVVGSKLNQSSRRAEQLGD